MQLKVQLQDPTDSAIQINVKMLSSKAILLGSSTLNQL